MFHEDLIGAIPALKDAQKALESTNPGEFMMIKALRSPPQCLVVCVKALMQLLAGLDPRVPIDKSGKLRSNDPWRIGQQICGNPQSLLATLSNYKDLMD